MEGPGTAPQPYLGLVLQKLRRVVAALPEDMRPGPNPYGFPWELVICATVLGIFAVLLFSWRGFRSIRSWLYVEREKKLAVELSILIEEKCKLLEKFSLVQKEEKPEALVFTSMSTSDRKYSYSPLGPQNTQGRPLFRTSKGRHHLLCGSLPILCEIF